MIMKFVMIAAKKADLAQDALLILNNVDQQPWDDCLIGCLIVCLTHRLADWLTDRLLDKWMLIDCLIELLIN